MSPSKEVKVDKLSVFLPAYNEEENIASTIKNVTDTLKELSLKDYEVIVINDASKDSTADVVKDLQKKDSHIKLVSHSENKGYGGALKTGFEEAIFPWVAFTDSDGQFDFKEISKFIDKADSADLVLGYRLNRADPFIRKVLTFGWKTVARVLLGLKARDYSCGFKMIKKQVYLDVLPLVSEEKVTQIEFLVKAQKKGFKFAEVGVHHYPRQFGQPTGGSIFSKVFIKSFIDLFKLWRIIQ